MTRLYEEPKKSPLEQELSETKESLRDLMDKYNILAKEIQDISILLVKPNVFNRDGLITRQNQLVKDIADSDLGKAIKETTDKIESIESKLGRSSNSNSPSFLI